jgi:acyl-coenzyme A synthetase/AMP-(fatty) acid ligase
VVAFEGDYSSRSVSLLLALMERSCVAVPLASVEEALHRKFLEISRAEFLVQCEGDKAGDVIRLERSGTHPLLEKLAQQGHPGLVLFTSGSTGQPKALLHDLQHLLEKFREPRHCLRILAFLLLDHIGGVNTLLYGLANGGTVIVVRERSPETVCRAIEKFHVEALPTSPTFLNLLLLSEEARRYDLSSLRLITYGTEVMPANTLKRLRETFPRVRLQQTYGLSEVGILRSKSREDGSLWVRVGGEGYETKVVGGVLWIRARSSMLGYLNAPSPFDEEGWFNTDDAVEQDGEWLRFLGRTSDIINVSGQKVYPAEVESVLLEMENVEDVTVRAERNPLTGQCVVARFNLRQPVPLADFKIRMWHHCAERLARYKIPVKIEFTETAQYTARCKHLRSTPVP